MHRLFAFPRAVVSTGLAAALVALSSCGGRDPAAAGAEAQPQAESRPALDGARVAGRDEALRIVALGAVGPLRGCEQAHAALVHAFERQQAAPGAVPAAGDIGIDIAAADNAEGLLLRGEAGLVRADLRFERAALGAALADGTVTLEVSRGAAGAGSVQRCQADALAVTDGLGTRHWSYLDVEVDAQRLVRRLSVVADVSVDTAAPLWIDVTAATPGRLVATGVIGFLKARLALQVGADGGWTVEVDNDKDGTADFVVHATAAEARALTAGR